MSAVAEAPVDHELVLLKQRQLLALRAKLAAIEADGLAAYRPHEKQHDFHRSAAKRRGVFAGNRFGKSECSAAETIAWFRGERTWYKFRFPIYGIREGKKVVVDFHDGHEHHPLVRQGIPQRATKQLIITTDWKKVEQVWTSELGEPPGKLWKFIPAKCKFKTKRNHEGIIDLLWDEDSGSVIRFTTEQAFMKNPQSSESTDYDRVGIDEPICNEMWVATARGLVDRDGTADFTLTSLRERWIYDYFFPPEGETVREDRFAVRATIFDNPHNTAASIERYEAEMTEDERECRMLGIPAEFSGLVYKQFIPQTHVLKKDQLPAGWSGWKNPPLDWTIYVAVDVHDALPQAALFVAVPPVGAPIVYDEIWRKCTTDELVDDVCSMVAGRSLGFIKADPAAWKEDPVFKVTQASRFFLKGLYIEPASKAKTFGITNLQSVLKARTKTADGRERPMLYFSPHVKQTLWEIVRYVFVDNKPVDKNDHFMECLYRLFITPLSYISLTRTAPVAEFDIAMTRSAVADYDVEAEAFGRAVGFNN